MNAKLQDAVDIFKALGWEAVTAENVLRLPLGDAAQKQTALDGLKSGEWGKIAEIQENAYGWRSFVDVEEGKLALFAIRVGVDAQRAVGIAHSGDSNRLLFSVIAQRGAKYAADFIQYACVSSRRVYEHAASIYGNVAVRLVEGLHLEIPQSVEYIKDYMVYAAVAMGLKAEIRYRETDLPELDMIKSRFADHMAVGVATNTPSTGPFGEVLPEGVMRGWLSREQGLALVFSALDAAVRPGDRKVWLKTLDRLGVTEEELCARVQAFIPLLAMGDSVMVMRLAPVLILKVEEDLLCEVLLASFSTTVHKTRQLVLKTALERSRPHHAEELAPWLSILAGDSHKSTAALAVKLMRQWGITALPLQEENAGIQELWKKTPPVWKVPPFRLGEVSAEALTELAAKLVNQAAGIHDVTAERFLAMTNALAKQDAKAARMSLKGLRVDSYFMPSVVNWVEEVPIYGSDVEGEWIRTPLQARDDMVSLKLGSLPCLLSTPSFLDLSITVHDLTERLIQYEENKTEALEADLLLALTRLDVNTQTPDTIKKLEKCRLPILLQSGRKMSMSAGKAVLAYLKDPVKEPEIWANTSYWEGRGIKKVDSLAEFPNRLHKYVSNLFLVFPLWGDFALRSVCWNYEVHHGQGLILRQAVRRAAPLPPGASINLLAAQRSAAPDAAQDSMRAVIEAWERGLLRPGVADIALLDWSQDPPFLLEALSTAFEGIISEGMLSVVWPILDALIGDSLKAPKLLAGTAKIAGLMADYLPEVLFAVEKGLAECTALHLPQLRALANRKGKSQAAETAQKVVALLPALEEEYKQKEEAPAMERPFDEIWPKNRESRPFIEDGVTVTVAFVDPGATSKLFLFTLTLPGITDRVFQVVKRDWYYDLQVEGQCQAYAAYPFDTGFREERENQVWLHWDEKQRAMAVCEHRNWTLGKEGPHKEVTAPRLPISLLTVLLGLSAQDDNPVGTLKRLIKKGELGADQVRRAMGVLLKNPVVSPAKLGRSLEKDIKLLPVLWPILTESIKNAGARVAEGNEPPVWVNRILAIALRYAPYLLHASMIGLIPMEDAGWEGLSEIASAKSKSAAVAKAKELTEKLTKSI